MLILYQASQQCVCVCYLQQSAGGGQGRPEVSSALGSGSGAYSGLSDAKFGRHDNSSPVQAALSQQLKVRLAAHGTDWCVL